MTVENKSSIDGVGFSKIDGAAMLFISDHLDWADFDYHVSGIESKIGAYLGFINGGQLKDALNGATYPAVTIQLFYLHVPSRRGTEVLSAIQRQLESPSVSFQFGPIPAGCEIH